MADPAFTVHLCPPTYPEAFEPFQCQHPPAMQICDAGIRWKPAGGGNIVVDHARCLGCGAPVGTGIKRNIFVDIACLKALAIGTTGAIRTRLDQMQHIYLRRAEILFGPDGWLGDADWRHLAEMIDPHLTMRVSQAGEHGDGTRFLGVHVDENYWPALEAEEPAQKEFAL
jgi:hypothetical protein